MSRAKETVIKITPNGLLRFNVRASEKINSRDLYVEYDRANRIFTIKPKGNLKHCIRKVVNQKSQTGVPNKMMSIKCWFVGNNMPYPTKTRELEHAFRGKTLKVQL